MSTTTTKLSPSARDHRNARFREIISRLKANVIFYIGQPSSGSSSLILTRRAQHPGDPDTQPFREAVTPSNRKGPYVSQYIERIGEIDRSYINPISSSSSSSAPSIFLVKPDPYLAEGFKRSLTLQKLKIPKLKPPVKPTVELEEGEILEDAASAKPTPSTSRPVGGNITNAAAVHALVHTVAGTSGASGSGAGRATRITSPSGRVLASTSKSRTGTKENERFDPRRRIPPPSLSSSQHQSSKKATPVMASSPISIATSRIVTMWDIIHAIDPAYVFADSMPLQIVTARSPHQPSPTYLQQIVNLYTKLQNMFPTDDLIDGEIEVLKTISSIINTTSVPNMPPYVAEALQLNASVVLNLEKLGEIQGSRKLTIIMSTILSLNQARLIEKKIEEKMLGEEGEEKIAVKVVKELERPSIFAPILLE